MKTASKYQPLYLFLVSQTARSITLSFAQIERILEFNLPASAWIYSAWWANEIDPHTQHTQSLAWTNANRNASPNFTNKTVIFTPQPEQPLPAPEPVTPEPEPEIYVPSTLYPGLDSE